MKDRIRSKRGFTLIEFMIVVCIFGMIVAIIIPQLQKYKEFKDNIKNEQIIIIQEKEQINDAHDSLTDSVNETGEMNKL